jgi:hypothetical protein
MAKRANTSAPWQDLEEQAYHAYREWPVWLVLRERELAARVGKHRGEKPKAPQGEQK